MPGSCAFLYAKKLGKDANQIEHKGRDREKDVEEAKTRTKKDGIGGIGKNGGRGGTEKRDWGGGTGKKDKRDRTEKDVGKKKRTYGEGRNKEK